MREKSDKKTKASESTGAFSRLTPKQEMFVKEYLIDLNATQSAIRAGYSAKRAEITGSELVRNRKVADLIQTEMDKRAAKYEITADRVLQEIAKLAFHDPRKFFDDDGRIKPISELDDDTAMALSGIETFHKIVGDEKDGMAVVTKIKTADKGANLERLGRHLKLFTDKIELNASSELAELLKSARQRVKPGA
jgi:phage terminase small subunit